MGDLPVHKVNQPNRPFLATGAQWLDLYGIRGQKYFKLLYRFETVPKKLLNYSKKKNWTKYRTKFQTRCFSTFKLFYLSIIKFK